MKNCWIGVSIGGSKGALGTPPRQNFFNFHAVFWQKSCIIKICMKMRTFGGQHLLLKIHDKQEYIPVGCVPPACCPYLPGVGGGACLWSRGVPSSGSRGGVCASPQVWAPGVGLETPPPGCGPGDPTQARPLNLPPGCGPEDLQGMLGYHPPPLWTDRHV